MKTSKWILSILISSCEKYEVDKVLGRGKYSEVFEGVDSDTGNKVVIKILKPVRKVKIYREIRILQILKDCPQIVKLLDVTLDPMTSTPSLIFEYLSPINLKQIMQNISLYDTKVYLYQILKALDFCHSRGIMHRDVKPMNVIVSPDTKKLRLIDWGLSEFFIPEKELNTRVSSRPYKSPELLVGYSFYNFSMDMWSFGCILAAIMFKKEHFFLGKDNTDQLAKIVSILGTNDFIEYIKKYNISVDPQDLILFKNKQKRDFELFITDTTDEFCSPEALDFIKRLLIYDHEERITAREALEHPFFSSVKGFDCN